MPNLAFIADVDVKRGYVSAVRSNGFRMICIDDESSDSSTEDIAVAESPGIVANAVIDPQVK